MKILDLRDKDKPEEVSSQLQKAAHKEATVWKALGNHPNCIRLHDLFLNNDFCYMVMEKCASGLLQALEKMPEINERGLGSVFAQMLLGISHCHGAKVVHRDVKPDNFLVGGEGGQTIKLGDFGLSAIMPKQGKLPGVFGTAPFMCPEMLVGKWYDEKADVWSFAVIVYVLLFGQFPYMPKQQSSKAMKQAIIDADPAPSFEPCISRSAAPNALMRSPDAVTLVRSLLNRDPEKRPSAEEALHMPWMSSAMRGDHMPGVDFPSLRPMLHSSKKVGAFEVRDPARDTNVDVLLNQLQMQKHGQPIPPTVSGGATSPARQPGMPGAASGMGDRRPRDEDRIGSKKSTMSKNGKDWETGSNRSTSLPSSSIGDSSSENGAMSRSCQGFRGSGWSKGTGSEQ